MMTVLDVKQNAIIKKGKLIAAATLTMITHY